MWYLASYLPRLVPAALRAVVSCWWGGGGGGRNTAEPWRTSGGPAAESRQKKKRRRCRASSARRRPPLCPASLTPGIAVDFPPARPSLYTPGAAARRLRRSLFARRVDKGAAASRTWFAADPITPRGRGARWTEQDRTTPRSIITPASQTRPASDLAGDAPSRARGHKRRNCTRSPPREPAGRFSAAGTADGTSGCRHRPTAGRQRPAATCSFLSPPSSPSDIARPTRGRAGWGGRARRCQRHAFPVRRGGGMQPAALRASAD